MRRAPLATLLCGLTALTAPAAAQDAVRGAAVFDETCAACHQSGGVGQPGLAPPLVDAALWTGLGEDAPTYFGSVVLGGLTGRITAAGVTYTGVAMPRHDWLKDDEIIDLAAYILGPLNGLEPELELDPETLTGLRGAPLNGTSVRDMRKAALE